MIIPKRKFNEYLSFLEEHKKYAGLPDWNIKLATETVEMEEFANVEANIYEKEMLVTLSDSYMKEPKKVRDNILIHELMHGKLDAYNKTVAEHVSVLEEHFVNDMTRGLESLIADNKKALRRKK